MMAADQERMVEGFPDEQFVGGLEAQGREEQFVGGLEVQGTEEQFVGGLEVQGTEEQSVGGLEVQGREEQLEEVQRHYQELLQKTVCADGTLEYDDFNPSFYGLSDLFIILSLLLFIILSLLNSLSPSLHNSLPP